MTKSCKFVNHTSTSYIYEATPQTSRANRVRVRRALSGHVTGSSIYREGPRWYK